MHQNGSYKWEFSTSEIRVHLVEFLSTPCRRFSNCAIFFVSNVLLPAATKLGQGSVFTGVCDSVHRGRRMSASVHAGIPPPPRSRPPSGAGPPAPPREQTPHREADASIRSMRGRYASYWNAFLFIRVCLKTYFVIDHHCIYWISCRVTTQRRIQDSP